MSAPPGPERARACIKCSRAKAKCVWPGTGSLDSQICQRCSNHGLECVRAPPEAKRKRGKSTHAKVLERKLDDIMLLLNRDRDQSARNSHALDSHLSPSTSLASTTAEGRIDGSYSPFHLTATSIEPPPETITIIPGYEVTFQEADQILQIYMSDMVPQFPFVPLSGGNGHDLYREKPLLFKTVVWVCRPPGGDLKVAFERWFRQHIAHRVVVLLEKSLEVLQSLLVFFAWSDIHYYATASDTSLMQLARGLADDLGLTRSPDLSTSTSRSIVENAAHLRDAPRSRAQHTNAGRRAVLGLFYINSVLCSLLGRSSRLDFARYFDDCCEKLSNDQELPTDSLLVHLIQTRKIALKVDDIFGEKDELANDRPFEGVHAMVIATVQKELDTFVNSLPDSLRSNYLLHGHCQAIRIRLFEPAIHAHVSNESNTPHIRSRMMWRCLASVQELVDAFLSLSVDTYPTLTFISVLHLALAIIKAAGLLTMEDRDWDLETARGSLNLPDTLQILSDRFSAGPGVTSPSSGVLVSRQPMLSAYAENYLAIRSWYLCKVGSAAATDVVPMMMDPVFLQNDSVPEGFEFWQQLSRLTYGALPNA